MSRLVEVEPGRWRILKPTVAPARSDLPRPYVISDAMPATEQVDGWFYTSKSLFRAGGRALGLIEVGNEKRQPKVRFTDLAETKRVRRATLKKALDRYRSGHRVRKGTP